MEQTFRLPYTLRRRINYERDCGQTIVLITGCFDLLHPGHLAVLGNWSRPGYFAVVGINSDASVARLKGPGRPIMDEGARLTLLCALKGIGAAFVFDDPTPEAVIRAVRPDLYVRGSEYLNQHLAEQAALDEVGARTEFRSGPEDASTSAIIRRCVDAHYAGLEKAHFGDLFTPVGDLFEALRVPAPLLSAGDHSLETIHNQLEAARAEIEMRRP